jgi:hypothetical protein
MDLKILAVRKFQWLSIDREKLEIQHFQRLEDV